MALIITEKPVTKIAADAAVYPAESMLEAWSAADQAVFEEAGRDELPKFIIHSTPPIWVDGEHRETERLAACYRSILETAEMLGCESVAIPLLAGEHSDKKKKKKLFVAVSEIRRFLAGREMDVTLSVPAV